MVSRFEQFTSAVFSINRCVQKLERIEMARFGLKGPHAQCLLAMVRHPEGITAGQLRNICDKDKAAISRTVADLEQEGMIERIANNGNRYRAILKLTPQGRQAALQVQDRAQLAVEKASEGMTDAERVIMYKALGLIAANLQNICAEGLNEKDNEY